MIVISVSHEEPVEIHIAFSELQTQYILSQPLHRSQEFVKKQGKRFVYKYFLVPNYEFISQILAWGIEVEVIHPRSIKNQIKQISHRVSAL